MRVIDYNHLGLRWNQKMCRYEVVGGRKAHPLYTTYKGLLNRCRQNKKGYKQVKVCARWRTFTNFVIDMGPRPSNLHSIDRIDNSGDYTPKNCRWATSSQQAHNRSVSNKFPGVRWHTKDGRFRAEITIGGKKTHLGQFKNDLSAALVVCEAKLVFGLDTELPKVVYGGVPRKI